MKKIAFTLTGYAHEFHPFIEDLSAKERKVQECAYLGNMHQMMSVYSVLWFASPVGYWLTVIAENSQRLDNIRGLLDDVVAKVMPLTQLGGEYIQSHRYYYKLN